MAPENEENGGGEVEEIAEEIATEVVDEIEDETPAETDVDVTVIEAPEPEKTEAKFSSVDVGDLHISGPAELVEKITSQYLKDHIDHNPHGNGEPTDIEETIADVAPEAVQEEISEQAAAEQVDNPPEPTDWLFSRRR